MISNPVLKSVATHSLPLHRPESKTMFFIPVGFRGDLKYLAQAFNFTRKPGKEQDEPGRVMGLLCLGTHGPGFATRGYGSYGCLSTYYVLVVSKLFVQDPCRMLTIKRGSYTRSLDR